MAKGIILPEITDELIDEIFNDAFFDDMMDKIFVNSESKTFVVDSSDIDSPEDKVCVNYDEKTKYEESDLTGLDYLAA